jgi:UDP-glucuronate 4-epimerase
MRFERFLVTGGAGFIGGHLTDALLGLGAQVVVVDDFNDYYDPAAKRRNVAPHLEQDAYTLVEGDIRDASLIDALVAQHKPQVVVHLAARAGVRPSLTDPHLYATTNVNGTLNLLEAARHGGVQRFIFGSSSSVYGLNAKVPFAETDTRLKPASPYAATKIAGEALCNSYAHLYGIPTMSLRFFTVFGPRQRPDLAIRKFAELMQAGRPIQLFGDGSTSRDYTFVADIVDGILSAIELDSVGHEIVNLGNSTPTTLADLVKTLEEVLGTTAQIERLPDQPGDVPRTFADVTKANALLGYKPRTTLREGITRMVEWMGSKPLP